MMDEAIKITFRLNEDSSVQRVATSDAFRVKDKAFQISALVHIFDLVKKELDSLQRG
jgi:hypothetical protein